jgi:hypothetical protein
MGQLLLNADQSFPPSLSPALGIRFTYECAFRAAQ